MNQLEMTQRQRHAARYVLHHHHNTSSVTDMLQTLGWRSLSDGRNDAKLCMIYKIANVLVGIPTKTYFIPVNAVTRKQHSLSYLIPHSRCNYHLYSFFPKYHSTLKLPPSTCCKSKQPLKAISRLHYSIFLT